MKSHRELEQQIPNLQGLTFQTARADQEMGAILECRWRGYRRYGFANPSACHDCVDAKAIHYVCRQAETNAVIGCLRMLPAHARPFELESYVNIANWTVDGVRPAELTRFSVPLNRQLAAVEFGL